MHTAPLRRFWRDRADRWAERWEADAGFRRSTSLLLTAITLALMGMCMLISMSIAHSAMPQWFGRYHVDVAEGHGQSINYPLATLPPIGPQQDPLPLAVATSNIDAPTAPTPTPTVTPTPIVVALTPTPALTCPVIAGLTVLKLQGGAIQDGTNPAPLIAGCAAQLMIAANQPNAPIAVALTFGTSNQATCTVQINSRTDGVGNATLAFMVPGGSCFHGDITTTGFVTVGGNSAANANFAAVG